MWKMRVAAIGGGISGLVSAYILAKNGVEVVLYEKEDNLGGHAKTVTIDGLLLDFGISCSEFGPRKRMRMGWSKWFVKFACTEEEPLQAFLLENA
ncbi:hypothetical protein FEM48_Zijuj07G0095500 [Ziziphus jujuba var. spinosa]|uniref:Uncharacterized protein n=1 Tax=Ziziphus jujuba var. spinosa TaxID=714518 RepID=A0A978V3V5_ZIZJJ|nr:hypothetical protein FEM48_Zijuj07G0095500 [Ziziphus jujuba var. spinosa]